MLETKTTRGWIVKQYFILVLTGLIRRCSWVESGNHLESCSRFRSDGSGFEVGYEKQMPFEEEHIFIDGWFSVAVLIRYFWKSILGTWFIVKDRLIKANRLLFGRFAFKEVLSHEAGCFCSTWKSGEAVNQRRDMLTGLWIWGKRWSCWAAWGCFRFGDKAIGIILLLLGPAQAAIVLLCLAIDADNV